MERTIISPEFKGGIWHKFFSTATKKDETLFSILDEKIRYYKLYYPFLEKKQVLGKAYEELYIPHICGEVNRKELHKLFLKERKTISKLKGKYKKYPSLFVENKSRNKGTIKKPIIPTTNQVKVNNIHSYIEKSKEDHAFDSLISNVNPKRKEGVIHNLNLKQTKSVRFNDGIEVHSVSPSQPLYKLKPLGRLFDEPSAIRVVNKPSFTQEELEERIEDSDSDFDADTGITSDADDYDIEDSPQMEDSNKNTEIAENEKVEENNLLKTNIKTIYDCSEDDSLTMDHEIRKEGNDLILSSKMITVVQGKWVREAKQIIGNTYHTKNTIMSSRKSVKEDTDDERQEIVLLRNIEYVLESIKSLCISNPQEHDTSSDIIDGGESKASMNVKHEQLMVGSIKVGQDLTDVEITIQDKNKSKNSKKVCSKIITSKISLGTDVNINQTDDKLLTIDNNELSYENDMHGMKNKKEDNIEKRIRTRPIKLVDDLIDYINDWNSSNEALLSHNSNLTSSCKPIHINDPEMDKYSKAEKDKEGDNIIEGGCSDNEEEDLSLEEKDCFDQQEDKLEHKSYSDQEEDSLEEKHLIDVEEDSLKDSSLEEKRILKEQNYSSLPVVTNNQQLYSEMYESNSSLDTTTQSIKIMKTEPSSLSDKLKSLKNETHDYLTDISIPFSQKNEVSEDEEVQVNDTFTLIKSMVCNLSTSSPNETHSTFFSLITKPILMQSQYVEEEEDCSRDNYRDLESFEGQELKEEDEKMQSVSLAPQSGLKYRHRGDIKVKEMAKRDNEIHENVNMRSSEEDEEKNFEGNKNIMDEPILLKRSVVSNISMDNSNSSLLGQRKDNGNCDNTSISDKKLVFNEPENILHEMETIEKGEDHIIIESEKNRTNLSSENLTMASQTSSVIASCNSDLLQRNIVDMEESVETNYNRNDSYDNNLSDEDSLTSGEGDNIFRELDSSSYLETASSTTVTPIKSWKYNSEEISTAYETDPETGKLVMNRYLNPVSNSTPIKQEPIDEPQDSVPYRRLDEHILAGSSPQSSHFVKQNKGDQVIEHGTENKMSLSTCVIDESTMGYSQCTNRNILSQLSSHASLLVANDEGNKTQTNDMSHDNKIDHDKTDQSHLTGSSIEKDSAIPSGRDKLEFQQCNIIQSNSESIIGNSESDSHRTFKKENIHNIVTSHPICSGKQEENIVTESYADRTEINSMDISIKPNIENCNAFVISETPESCTDKPRSSCEAAYENSIQINEALTNKKNVSSISKITDKTSADSHSTDIIYDTSNITEDYKLGRYTKTSTVDLASAIEEQGRISESENLIDENELIISDKLVTTDNNKRLSAISEGTINLDSNFNEKLKTDLEMQETVSKKNVKNRHGNVSHITFLIRDTKPGEHEPGYQQLIKSSQLARPSKTKQDQNEKSATSEILSPTTKIYNAEETHETLEVSGSKFLDNNGSHFSLGVENSHIESISTEKHKYFTRSRTYLSLKRKLGTINENYSESDISPSHDELSGKEMEMNISVHSTVAQSVNSSDTSDFKMNLKRVNTDIRRKRAKLKKEIPVRKSSTSSSEDEIKKPWLLKGKDSESSRPAFCKFAESNIKMKQTNKFEHEGSSNTVDVRTQKNTGISYTDPKDDVPRNFSSLTQSFQNKGTNDDAMNRKKDREYNQLSDSSSSIIYSSPNVKPALHDVTKAYDKMKIHFDNKINKRHLEEENQNFSGAKSAKKINQKSHKSYPLYRKYDGLNKENPNISQEESRPSIRSMKNPERLPHPGKSDTVSDVLKDRASKTKNPNHDFKKNKKSSIVRLIGTADATQISNSPEVKGLLRRTYFMGNH